MDKPGAAASGTFKIGGDLEITRLGYGSMQLTGDGVWARRRTTMRRSPCSSGFRRSGSNFIDMADSYGPDVAEGLIREALHPYPGLVVATKAGLTRTGPQEWHPLGRPAYAPAG